ncbi:MAG TPA: DUF6448 family protein, partial [Saprospiraceae bacterium]|nr:DUF6448 family protein [Saprospiraceae bacterium]
MDGPVVKAAQKALETGNVNLVLIWVQNKDEALITDAFKKTLAMRVLSPEAKNFADMYFFETLVRLHRAGEGAPYTGLKPAGSEIESGIKAADEAIAQGSAESLLEVLSSTIRQEVLRRFNEVKARSAFGQNDIEAGRGYVRAYVEFIHYVERIHQDVAAPVDHQHQE